MTEFIRQLIEYMLDSPNELKIIELKTSELYVYELQVAKSDFGKILGKRGRNMDAIRLIVGAVAKRKFNRAVRLHLVEK